MRATPGFPTKTLYGHDVSAPPQSGWKGLLRSEDLQEEFQYDAVKAAEWEPFANQVLGTAQAVSCILVFFVHAWEQGPLLPLRSVSRQGL